jgi:hypothetical protein
MSFRQGGACGGDDRVIVFGGRGLALMREKPDWRRVLPEPNRRIGNALGASRDGRLAIPALLN